MQGQLIHTALTTTEMFDMVSSNEKVSWQILESTNSQQLDLAVSFAPLGEGLSWSVAPGMNVNRWECG